MSRFICLKSFFCVRVWCSEIDNIAYRVGLSEPMRTKIEQEARIELNAKQMESLVRTKTVHATLIVLCVVASVLVLQTSGGEFFAAIPFLVGGIAEAVVPGLTTTEIVKSVGVVMGKMALGAVGFAGFLALAYIS